MKLCEEGAEVFETVGRCLQDDNGDGELRNVLLKGQVAVNGDEDVEVHLGPG